MNPNILINGTNPASCTEGPAAFCDEYAQGYPHGIEAALGRELGVKAADDDWNLKSSNPNFNPINTPEITPPCPSGHITDWCNGFKGGYEDEWSIVSDAE